MDGFRSRNSPIALCEVPSEEQRPCEDCWLLLRDPVGPSYSRRRNDRFNTPRYAAGTVIEMTTNYYFYNTDNTDQSLKGAQDRYRILIDKKIAATSGPRKFGEQFK